MQTFLVLLFIGAMIATVVALVRGIVTFLKDAGEEARGGGTGDGPSARALKSNRMMQMRILWQGVAIILLVLILFSAAGRT